jgi:hypothetical protein
MGDVVGWRCLCDYPGHGTPYTCYDQALINYNEILSYDTSWEATGPLIERYGITLYSFLERETPDLRWLAGTERWHRAHAAQRPTQRCPRRNAARSYVSPHPGPLRGREAEGG